MAYDVVIEYSSGRITDTVEAASMEAAIRKVEGTLLKRDIRRGRAVKLVEGFEVAGHGSLRWVVR